MASTVRNEYVPDVVSPPGVTLQDVLEERDLSQADLADRTGRTKKTINEIIKGKAPITPETALQLEKVLGIPAAFWDSREMAYRSYLARKAETDRLKQQVDWIREVPYLEMARKGWVPESPDKIERVRALLSYFAVASQEQWRDIAIRPQASFRRSKRKGSDPGALSVWLRQGEIHARRRECGVFDPQAFRRVLEEAKRLTLEPPEVFVPALQAGCGRCGVAVVFVPELRKLCVWGATRWVSPTRAVIQLSLRYKTDDHLWFTFFHEAAHILLHNKRDVFVESDGAKSEEEKSADRFAANHLIPPREFQRLQEQGPHSEALVREFAAQLGIAPGIVVGRLQHDRLLPFSHLNGLKRRFRWAESDETDRE
jgi:HTH-type transcriptional regulator / antitoxin HigA